MTITLHLPPATVEKLQAEAPAARKTQCGGRKKDKMTLIVRIENR